VKLPLPAVFVLPLASAALACPSGSRDCPRALPAAEDAASVAPARALSPLPPLPWKRAAICHGGVGSPVDLVDGPRAAVDAESRAKSEKVRQALLAHDPSVPADWQGFDWRGHWNFERPLAEAGLSPRDAGTETVGCAVRGSDGRFGVALSTGGTSITLRGRVGDVPILGAGLYASKAGAFAATGTGERIVEKALAREGVKDLERGVSPADVAKHAVDSLRGKDIGVIVIGPDSLGEDADRPMAWAGREVP
jgi:hypothetical protein